jgi:hypothetical protein
VGSAAGSIPPFATSQALRGAAVALQPKPARASRRPAAATPALSLVPSVPQPARASRRPAAAPPSLSLVPLAPLPVRPPPAVVAAPAPAPAAAAVAGPDYVLTAIAFKPDGGHALTLRVGFRHCIAAALLLTAGLGAALAFGWVLGEWTARL